MRRGQKNSHLEGILSTVHTGVVSTAVLVHTVQMETRMDDMKVFPPGISEMWNRLNTEKLPLSGASR